MAEGLYSNSREFAQAVRILRGMAPRHRWLAAWAAENWDERQLDYALRGDMAGSISALPPAYLQ